VSGPPTAAPYVPAPVEIDGVWYVAIRSPQGISAVYRVQSYGALMLVTGDEARKVRDALVETAPIEAAP